RRSWLDCLSNAPNGRIDLHPDFAVAAGTLPDPAVLYTHRAELSSKLSSETPLEQIASFTTVAVLGARPRRVGFLPKLPWRVNLRERFLVANRVLGDTSAGAMAPFVEGLCDLLRAGEADWLFFDDLEVGSALWDLLAASKNTPGVAV